ncbi:MAG: hypothetical protein OEN01_13395 [Candidatus Krumholzibacteria bacterium]|nr:hypothetical protein [Candidatus Krumholzibacteria bacterium]
MIGVLFYKLGAFFARRLPQHVSESITEIFVRFQYIMRFRSRRIVMSNLRVVLGDNTDDKELREFTRRVFSNFGRSIYYFLRLPFIDKSELRRRCDYGGIDALTGARGTYIFVGPHMGTWEVGGACLTALGVSLRTVALPHPSSRVTRFFNQRRELLGIECSSIQAAADSLRKALRAGKSVALLIDRIYGGTRGTFRWFGREVEMPLGHVALAVRCRIPIVTTACVFEGRDGFKFLFNGPHHPRADLAYRAAMIDLQERCIEDMESFIRRHPEQWFHFQPLGGPRR